MDSWWVKKSVLQYLIYMHHLLKSFSRDKVYLGHIYFSRIRNNVYMNDLRKKYGAYKAYIIQLKFSNHVDPDIMA